MGELTIDEFVIELMMKQGEEERLREALARIKAQALSRRTAEGNEPPGPRRAVLSHEAVAYEDAAQILEERLEGNLTGSEQRQIEDVLNRAIRRLESEGCGDCGGPRPCDCTADEGRAPEATAPGSQAAAVAARDLREPTTGYASHVPQPGAGAGDGSGDE